jgi:hypothetical protein
MARGDGARTIAGVALVRDDALVFGDLEGCHLHPERFSRTWCRASPGIAQATHQPVSANFTGRRRRY